MKANTRGVWGTSLGFVLAAAGSAVGVGNLWKFPYVTWENGGGSFVIIYLASAAFIGIPILISELIIGRKSGLSAVPAMEKLGKRVPGGRAWKYAGWLGLLGSSLILSYVVVIAGWAITYAYYSLKWSLTSYSAPASSQFVDFIANTPLQLLLSSIFMALTAIIVYRGIGAGIERANKILMPALFVMLVLLLLNSLSLSGFSTALDFLFSANFDAISGQSVLEAMGQAFFSLSLGMGIMITYGSYMQNQSSIPRAATVVVAMDTFVAIIASIIIFSIIFTIPSLEDTVSASTTGMLFTTLPALFYTELPAGEVAAPLFYLLVTFAALSSTISLLEVAVALMIDRHRLSRARATIYASLIVFIFTVMVALSLNPNNVFSGFQFFGTSESGFLFELNQLFFRGKVGFMNVIDHLVANWLLPVTGLLSILFVGWFLNRDEVKSELHRGGRLGGVLTNLLLIATRYLGPIAILYILYQILFGGQDFS